MRSVPDAVRQAATAMGFGTLRRLVQVELPIAVPIVIAGLRVAVVSSISLASVGQLIGVTSLGYLIIDGYQRDFPEEIYVGGGLIIALALVCDLLLVLLRRALTPWQPRRARRQAQTRCSGSRCRRCPEVPHELPQLRLELDEAAPAVARLRAGSRPGSSSSWATRAWRCSSRR